MEKILGLDSSLAKYSGLPARGLPTSNVWAGFLISVNQIFAVSVAFHADIELLLLRIVFAYRKGDCPVLLGCILALSLGLLLGRYRDRGRRLGQAVGLLIGAVDYVLVPGLQIGELIEQLGNLAVL